MSEAEAAVTESELHAYLDGELTSARVDAVEAHFLADESDAMRFGIYRRQSDLIRRLYSQVDRQPVANDLLPLIPTVVRIRPKPKRLRLILVPLVVLMVGAAAGWFGRPYYEEMQIEAAPLNEALAAHRISQRSRPTGIEVLGGDGRATIEWLEREFDFQTTSPDPNAVGFSIVGGQLIPSTVGIAAQLQLRAGPDDRLTLYIQPGGAAELTAFRSATAPRERMVTWQASGATLVLVGGLPEARLRAVAEAIQTVLIGPFEETNAPT